MITPKVFEVYKEEPFISGSTHEVFQYNTIEITDDVHEALRDYGIDIPKPDTKILID